MMTQENYVNINDLHTQGWTIVEIAEETGWHRTTVSKYLKKGPPPRGPRDRGDGDDRALAGNGSRRCSSRGRGCSR